MFYRVVAVSLASICVAYAQRDSGVSVRPRCAGAFESWQACVSVACPPSCAQPLVRCRAACRPACGCIDGYVRDENDRCIPIEECKDFKSLPGKCLLDKHCRTGYECGSDINCVRAPCFQDCKRKPSVPLPPAGRCSVDMDCKSDERCGSGVVCVTQPCYQICEKKDAKPPRGMCLKDSDCRRNQQCGSGRVCAKAPCFQRCVRRTPDRRCARRTEKWNDCGTACPRTCANKHQPPQACIEICKSGCECRRGYVRDETTGRCVRPGQCGRQRCRGRHEVFAACASLCPETCAKAGECDGCAPGCQCRDGYVRRAPGGPCVKRGTCPAKPDCPLPTPLARPPPGCRYIHDEDSNGCPINHRLVCPCPVFKLIAPRPGCMYAYEKNERNCLMPRQVCFFDEKECVPPEQPAPEEECHYVADIGADGCQTNFRQVCDNVSKPPCAQPDLMMAPANCKHIWDHDEHGCQTHHRLQCTKPEQCPVLSLPAPTNPACKWRSYKDLSGCESLYEKCQFGGPVRPLPLPAGPKSCLSERDCARNEECSRAMVLCVPDAPCRGVCIRKGSVGCGPPPPLAAPPPGCRYVWDTDANGCRINYRLKCECRSYKMTAPRPGCTYTFVIDEHGCKADPQQICFIDATPCAMPTMPPPQPGCTWVSDTGRDGCPTNYHQACKSDDNPPCALPGLTPPPAGCKWVWDHDQFGCETAHRLLCPRPKDCQPVALPAIFGNSPCRKSTYVDRRGCLAVYERCNSPTRPPRNTCDTDEDCAPGQACSRATVLCAVGQPCPGICVPGAKPLPSPRRCTDADDCETDETCSQPLALCRPGSADCRGTCVKRGGVVGPPLPKRCTSRRDCARGERCSRAAVFCVRGRPCPGVCVKSGPAQKCPRNERYNACGTACPLTCDNYKNPPRICVMSCKVGCECRPGFVRDEETKRCVRRRKCGKRECGRNEQFSECSSACPDKCSTIDTAGLIACAAVCRVGCACKPGFVIDDRTNNCIRRNRCPRRPPPTGPPACDTNADCAPGQTCSRAAVSCVAHRPCKGQCVGGGGTAPSCGAFEIFRQCSSCEPSCERPHPICTLECRPPRCQCQSGYVRARDGRCIKLPDCPRLSISG